jgi:saccharopine dehydrogenase (NADP+, L-glutamate forming)
VSDRSVLVLGAGFVAGPVVRYLLEKTGARVRIASLEGAEELAAGHERAEAVPLDAGDEPRIEELARDADLVVSLLPPPFHPRVARIAVRLGKPMVTTSYVGDEMRALDEEARGAGVILINEVGVDPGLDHMTALRTLDRIRAEGGRVVSFRSHCGGLPSAEANDNPLGYKFSWAPRGVLTAARRPARYLLDGAEIPVPGDDILGDVRPLDLGEDGVYESYPNGDAMGYVPLYGLEDAHTVYRGTLRYPGHCRAWKAMVDLGLLDEGEREVAGKTWAGLVRDLAGLVADAPVREGVAARLGLEVSEDPLVRMAWLGLFDETPVPAERRRAAGPPRRSHARAHGIRGGGARPHRDAPRVRVPARGGGDGRIGRHLDDDRARRARRRQRDGAHGGSAGGGGVPDGARGACRRAGGADPRRGIALRADPRGARGAGDHLPGAAGVDGGTARAGRPGTGGKVRRD